MSSTCPTCGGIEPFGGHMRPLGDILEDVRIGDLLYELQHTQAVLENLLRNDAGNAYGYKRIVAANAWTLGVDVLQAVPSENSGEA